MADVIDWRLLELQLEDLYGRLQALKRDPDESGIDRTRRLLEISAEIRNVSVQLRCVRQPPQAAQRFSAVDYARKSLLSSPEPRQAAG